MCFFFVFPCFFCGLDFVLVDFTYIYIYKYRNICIVLLLCVVRLCGVALQGIVCVI